MLRIYWPYKAVPTWLQEVSAKKSGVPACIPQPIHKGFGLVVNIRGTYLVCSLLGTFMYVDGDGCSLEIRGGGSGVEIYFGLFSWLGRVWQEARYGH